jgi:uncharacterized membrane protein
MTTPPPSHSGHSGHSSHSSYRRSDTAADLTRGNVQAMRRLDDRALAKRSGADRVAEFVARFCGSIVFVWIHAGLFGAWIAWNAIPGLPHFDPYPFTFLVLCVSLEAIFLSSFILISQNYEMRISDRRTRLDLQINLLAEQENTKMLQMLSRISKQLGLGDEDDPEIRALEEATRPETLARQIEEAYREHAQQQHRRGDKARK